MTSYSDTTNPFDDNFDAAAALAAAKTAGIDITFEGPGLGLAFRIGGKSPEVLDMLSWHKSPEQRRAVIAELLKNTCLNADQVREMAFNCATAPKNEHLKSAGGTVIKTDTWAPMLCDGQFVIEIKGWGTMALRLQGTGRDRNGRFVPRGHPKEMFDTFALDGSFGVGLVCLGDFRSGQISIRGRIIDVLPPQAAQAA